MSFIFLHVMIPVEVFVGNVTSGPSWRRDMHCWCMLCSPWTYKYSYIMRLQVWPLPISYSLPYAILTAKPGILIYRNRAEIRIVIHQTCTDILFRGWQLGRAFKAELYCPSLTSDCFYRSCYHSDITIFYSPSVALLHPRKWNLRQMS